MNRSYPNIDMKRLSPFLLGSGIGLLGLSMFGYFKDKTMTKFEKTAVAFIGALCSKIEELQEEIEKLRKVDPDTVPRKTYTDMMASCHMQIDEQNKRIAELKAELAELKKKPRRKTS